MKCGICECNIPTYLPCNIQPRHYVDEDGFIVAVINGCPLEDNQDPDYLSIEILQRSEREDIKDWMENASKITYQDYENLWASWNRKNYHLDFDAEEALRTWVSSLGDSVFIAYKGGSGRGSLSYNARVRWIQLTRRFQVVSHNP